MIKWILKILGIGKPAKSPKYLAGEKDTAPTPKKKQPTKKAAGRKKKL